MNIRKITEERIKERESQAIKKAHFSMVESRRVEDVKEEIGFLNKVELELQVQLGSTDIILREVMNLHEGQVIVLDRLAGDAVDLMVGNVWLARGEVLILNEALGIRISSFNKEEENSTGGVK